MKKITAILTAAILLAAMLAACADPSKAGAKSAGAVTDTQTETGLGSDTEPLEIPTQTEAAPDSTTAEQPETPPEEPEDTTPVPERGVTLNTDLLGEYKMTYAELTAKHGKMTGFAAFEGGSHYKFENGYGYYWIYYPEWPSSESKIDPEGGFEYYIIDDETKRLCRGISRISPEKMFIGDYETLSIEEISKLDGIHYLETGKDGIVTPRAYCSIFTYDGWNNDNVKIYIYHEKKNMIDLTSECEISIYCIKLKKKKVVHINYLHGSGSIKHRVRKENLNEKNKKDYLDFTVSAYAYVVCRRSVRSIGSGCFFSSPRSSLYFRRRNNDDIRSIRRQQGGIPDIRHRNIFRRRCAGVFG